MNKSLKKLPTYSSKDVNNEQRPPQDGQKWAYDQETDDPPTILPRSSRGLWRPVPPRGALARAGYT